MFGYLRISWDISGYVGISFWGELPDAVSHVDLVRECLQYFILHSHAPALVAYLEDWAAADARDGACVRAELLGHNV
jgi:hypothetical protein